MQKQTEQIVDDFRWTYVAVRIPDLHLEWILVDYAAAALQYLIVGDVQHLVLRQIVDGDAFLSANSNCYELTKYWHIIDRKLSFII